MEKDKKSRRESKVKQFEELLTKFEVKMTEQFNLSMRDNFDKLKASMQTLSTRVKALEDTAEVEKKKVR